jgi:uncharacterized protein (DUF4415 family)
MLKRGPVIPVPKGKTRIVIRLDEDVIAWFGRTGVRWTISTSTR